MGRAILERAFKNDGAKYSDKSLSGVLNSFQKDSVDDLLAHVGAGHATGRKVMETVFPGNKKGRRDRKVVSLAKARHKKDGKKGEAIPIKGLIPGMAVHYALCCHPLPGDRIVGIITTGKGVTIHTIDCETLKTLSDEPERWLDVSWESAGTGLDHVARIDLTVLNEPGSLGDLSTVIAKNEANIFNLKITNRSADFYDLTIDIEVEDVKHLTDIIAALRATPSINSVERARG